MIDKLSHGFINSVYDFKDYTLNELICKLVQKMDEVITQSNESFSYLDWLKGQGLTDEIINVLTEWKDNGTLDTIINGHVFNEINNSINEINNSINDLIQRIEQIENNSTSS